VDGLLDLLFVSSGEDERDASDDDVHQAQDGRDHETERDDGRKNLEDGAILNQITDHKKWGREE
jgi:hypothetical protein